MLVKNLKGSSDKKCNCNSWLEHWEKFSGEKANYCSVNTCYSKATLGAHVIKVNSYDKNTYVVPFCDSHNKSDSNLEIGNTKLVSANVNETCGKRNLW